MTLPNPQNGNPSPRWSELDSNGFLWGVATSAFQIEGHIENDMTDWERRGRFQREGRDPRYNIAVDHWHRWEEDFELLRRLGVNAYRFSIEWARIEPSQGSLNESALDQYCRMIDRLLDFGITPMVTLHHFTHPTWFHETTPWHADDSIRAFERFADIVSRRLADRVRLWVTLNEPLVWVLAGYGDCQFPPGERDLHHMMAALRNMLCAHRQAYDIIKSHAPSAAVGIANNFIAFAHARQMNLLDRGLARLLHGFYNEMILDAFKNNRLHCRFPFLLNYDESVALDDRIDFWGINYYYRAHVKFQLERAKPFRLLFLDRSGEGLSDLGWESYSSGLRQIIQLVSRANKPMYVTENGVATTDDKYRTEFARLHIEQVRDAASAGFDMRGYFHWSLLDNYEWLVGESARFGLYRVDFANGLGRHLTETGKWYSELISQLNENQSV